MVPVHIDHLAEHAARIKAARTRVLDPPLVTVGALGKRRRERRGRVMAAIAGRLHPLRRNNAAAILQIEQADARIVAQAGVEAAIGQRASHHIDGEAGALLRAHGLPEFLRHDLVEPFAGDALHAEAQHLGLDRTVGEALAVAALELAQTQHLLEDMARPAQRRISAGRNGLPAGRDVKLPNVGMGVGVGLVEGNAAPHVEDMLQQRAAIGGVIQFGNIVRDGCVDIQQALANQHTGRGGGHRFRHRLRQVQRTRRHAIEVALIDDGAILEHDETIRVGVVEQAGERGHRPLDGRNRQRIEVLFLARQCAHRCVTAPDLGGGQDLPDVLKGPSVPRRAVPVHARRHQLRR